MFRISKHMHVVQMVSDVKFIICYDLHMLA